MKSINITISSQMYDQILSKAQQVGLSLTEYVKNVIITDVKGTQEDIEMVDAETNRRIGQSLDDIKTGRYTILRTEKDIEDHFNNL